jgi:hypothetical protein
MSAEVQLREVNSGTPSPKAAPVTRTKRVLTSRLAMAMLSSVAFQSLSAPTLRAGRKNPPMAGTYAGPVKSQPVEVGRNQPCPCGSGKKFKKCCRRLV